MRGISSILTALLCGAFASCSHIATTTKGEAFANSHADFTYCEIDAVKQNNQIACGAAAVAAVATYWGVPTSEAEILATHPTDRDGGYTLGALANAAGALGLQTFILASETDAQSLATLREHLAKGRPIIVAWLCPFGRYFDNIPLIESLDSRSLNLEPFQAVHKNHFVVVCGYRDDFTSWLIMDPAYGIVKIDTAKFLDYWRGGARAMLLISP